jgi:hypothetical protein
VGSTVRGAATPAASTTAHGQTRCAPQWRLRAACFSVKY